MEGPAFKHKQATADEDSFKPYAGELPSDLKSKLAQCEGLYKTMTDPVAKKCALLLAEASILAANVADVSLNPAN